MRMLLDISESMVTGDRDRRRLKFDYARKLAAALCYVGLVRLDSICLQPFGELWRRVSVRRRTASFSARREFPAGPEASRAHQLLQVAREFISTYPQRGLLMIISDFLDDAGCERPLQYLSDFGHELILVQVWAAKTASRRGMGSSI